MPMSFIARLAVTLLFMTGCSPLVTVVREERPLATFAPELQPVQVSPSETGVKVLDFLNLFTDSHARDVAAAQAVTDALRATQQVLVVDDCSNQCPETRTRLMAGLDVADVSATPDANGAVSARVGLVIVNPASNETERYEAKVSVAATPAEALSQALADAAHQFAVRFLPSEQHDSFWLENAEPLKPGNALIAAGDLSGATAFFRQRVEANPKDIASWVNLSVVLTAAGDLAGAAEAAHQAANNDSSSMRINRENAARDADYRRDRTTRVMSFTSIK